MFAPQPGGTELEQIRKIPFSITLKGNPAAFENIKMFVDFMTTDGTNDVVDTGFFQYQLPAFVDPVNGDDENRGGIKEPLKTLNRAMYYCYGKTHDQDNRIYITEGTLKGGDNQIWQDERSWHLFPTRRIEFLGGFNPRTWERDPAVFETVWSGENQRRFIYDISSFAVKLDGFTFKDGVEHSIQLSHDNQNGHGYYYYGTNDITNNIFQNNNGNSIIKLHANAGRKWLGPGSYDGYLSIFPVRTSVGAPLTNAASYNGAALFSGEGSHGISITNPENVELSDFTLEAWIYPRNINRMDYHSTDMRGNLFRIYKGGDDLIDFYIKYHGYHGDKKLYARFKNTGWSAYYGQEIEGVTEIAPGQWHHVAITMKKDSADPNKHIATLYLDGVYENRVITTHASPFSITPNNVYFGSLDGVLDEARIWNRALSFDEIRANRDKEVMDSYGLVCAMHFNEKSGVSYSSKGDFAYEDFSPWHEENPAFNISNNLFEDNKAEGIYADSGIMHTLIHNNIYRNNQNLFYRQYSESPFIQISNNVIKNNNTPDQIALFYSDSGWQNQWIINNTIMDNDANVFLGEDDDGWDDRYRFNCILNNIIYNNTGATNIDNTNVGDIPGRYVYNLIPEAEVDDPVIDPDWSENFTCSNLNMDADGYHLLADSCARGGGPVMSLPGAMPSIGGAEPIMFFDDQDDTYLKMTTSGDNPDYAIYDSSYAWGGEYTNIRRGIVTGTWDIPVTTSGKYEVSTYIARYGPTRPLEIPYQITDKTGTTNIIINTSDYSDGGWANLGTFDIDAAQGLKMVVNWTDEDRWLSLPLDDIRIIYRPDTPAPGTTAPPSAFIAHNFWNLDEDIDGQYRPVDAAWDVGADQYVSADDQQGAMVKAYLMSGSSRLAGLPFDVGLQLMRNYDDAPGGFSFKVQYPAGAISELTATTGELGAEATVGAETAAGSGLAYRTVTAIPGNTSNTERNPQLIELSFTVADPYPDLLTIEILPPDSGSAVVDTSGSEIPVSIDDSLLKDLAILAPNPIANFSGVPTRGLVNPAAGLFLPVYFQDASIGYVTSWEWDFGDGITSFEKNPMHEYIAPGTYTVTLTVEGPYGKSTKIREDYIVASDPTNPPEANFTAEPYSTANQRVEGPAPLRVEFLDATNGPTSSFSWDFGDGDTSTAQNPTKIYQSQGDYTVTLDVDGPMGGDSITKTNLVHVTAPETPSADFAVDNPYGYAPHSVKFTNQSSGSDIQFYYYDFGDGNWSQSADTGHEYILPGDYNATLTVAGSTGFNVSNPKTIEVKQAFPEKVIKKVLLGTTTITAKERTALDFNSDGKLDVADIITYLGSGQ